MSRISILCMKKNVYQVSIVKWACRESGFLVVFISVIQFVEKLVVLTLLLWYGPVF